MKLAYQDHLSALIHEPSFEEVAGEAVFSKARVINTKIHDHHKRMAERPAVKKVLAAWA